MGHRNAKALNEVAAVYSTVPVQSKLDEFKALLRKQYGYAANDAQCSGDRTAAIRDSKRAAMLKQAENGEVTAVTFSYTPAAATAAAPAPAPKDSAAVAGSVSLDPGNLKDPWLQKARDELKGSKGWCETNITLHRVFDCDCFARLVFHPGEARGRVRGSQSGGGNPLARPKWGSVRERL